MYEKRNIPLAPEKHFFCPTDTEKPALPPPQGENKAGLPNAAENPDAPPFRYRSIHIPNAKNRPYRFLLRSIYITPI